MYDSILWEIVGVLFTLFDCALVTYFIHTIFTSKYKSRAIPVGFALGMTAFLVFLNGTTFNPVAILLFALVTGAYSFLTMRERWIQKIFWAFMIVFYFVLVEMLVATVFMFITHTNSIMTLYYDDSSRVIATVIFRVIISVSLFVFLRFKSRNNFVNSFSKTLFFVIPITSLYVILELFRNYLGQISNDQMKIEFLAGIILLNVLCYFLIRLIYIESQKVIKATAEIQLIKMEKMQYDQMISSFKSLRLWRHDFNNHILATQEFLYMQKYDEAYEYISELSHRINAESFFVNTGNLCFDAILNIKSKLAEENGVRLACNLEIPETIVQAYDLCSILGNILDNAIEASLQLQSKSLRNVFLKTKVLSNKFILSCCNNFSQPIRYLDNQIMTSKEEHEHHGYGISIIEKVTNKYNGICNYEVIGEEFKMCIMIPLATVPTQMHYFKHTFGDYYD